MQTDRVNFQGERSLHRLGLHKAGNKEPEFRDSWQFGSMMMPRVLTGWRDGQLLTGTANRVMSIENVGRSKIFLFILPGINFHPLGALLPR